MLLIVAMLLSAGALVGTTGAISLTMVLLAMAMGAMNNVFERNGEVSLGVTYMTGSLVKLGQRIAAGLLGLDRFGWVPYLLFWLSFVLGVIAGAAAYPVFGLMGIWGAALVVATAGLSAEISIRRHDR